VRVSAWPLIIAVALDMMGFAMIIPDIQLRAEGLGAPGWMIGAILASTFVIQFFISPWWGARSDRLGRKNVFLFCTSLSAVSMALYAMADAPGWLLLSRILAGFGAANIAVAQASVVDGETHEDRTPALARLSAAQNFGMILGPGLGGWIATAIGSSQLGWIACGLSALGVLIVAIKGQFPAVEEISTRRAFGFGALLKSFPHLVPLVVLAAIAWFSLSALEGTFGRLLKAEWGYGSFEFGMLFSFESALILLVQAVFLTVITKRFKPRMILVVGYLFQGLGLAMTPFAPGLAVLFLCSGLYAFGVSIANPTVNALCSQQVPDDRQGELFGVLQSARSVGFALGPLLGGILFDWKHAAPYLLAGGVCLFAAMLAPWASRNRGGETPNLHPGN